MATGNERLARARACVGVRFRAYGRDPRYGLDCVGVAAIAFGRTVSDPYAPRGGDPATIARGIAALGLVKTAEPAAGDLLLIDAGAGQLHLAIRSDRGFVHAEARLRKVVETPGAPGGVIAAWTEEG